MAERMNADWRKQEEGCNLKIKFLNKRIKECLALLAVKRKIFLAIRPLWLYGTQYVGRRKSRRMIVKRSIQQLLGQMKRITKPSGSTAEFWYIQDEGWQSVLSSMVSEFMHILYFTIICLDFTGANGQSRRPLQE